jgi:hypothetical protein
MGNPASSAFKPGVIDPEVAARWAEVVRLRHAGLTFEAIARQLGYAHASGAHNAYQSAIAQTVQQPADEHRVAELERLDALYRALLPIATRVNLAKGPDGKTTVATEPSKRQLETIDRLVKVMERRAKLLGLDAPERHAHDHTNAGKPFGAPAGFDSLADDDLDKLDAIARRMAGHGPNGCAGGD